MQPSRASAFLRDHLTGYRLRPDQAGAVQPTWNSALLRCRGSGPIGPHQIVRHRMLLFRSGHSRQTGSVVVSRVVRYAHFWPAPQV